MTGTPGVVVPPGVGVAGVDAPFGFAAPLGLDAPLGAGDGLVPEPLVCEGVQRAAPIASVPTTRLCAIQRVVRVDENMGDTPVVKGEGGYGDPNRRMPVGPMLGRRRPPTCAGTVGSGPDEPTRRSPAIASG